MSAADVHSSKIRIILQKNALYKFTVIIIIISSRTAPGRVQLYHHHQYSFRL